MKTLLKPSKEFELIIDSESDLLTQLKDFEQRSSQRLAQGFSDGRTVRELVMARARHIDNLLISLWQHLEMPDDYSLVAVGGFGRGELHPYSDIDLLILTPGKSEQKDQQKLSPFITLLWDIGLTIGHATRTVKQCLQLAKQDITVVTNLMESRVLCGNHEQFEKIKQQTAPNKIWDAEQFFNAKMEERRERYNKFNGSSYDLEPNIKSSPGGLRDIQLIAWIAERSYYPKSVFELITQKVITKKEYYTLVKCQLFLWRIRFALHLVTDKAEDRLLFDHQKSTAELMGFEDSDNLMAVEKMMKRYYRSVQIIRNISDILLQSLEAGIAAKRSKIIARKIDSNYQIVNHRLDAIDVGIFSSDPNQLIKIFQIAALNPEVRGLTAATSRAIRAARNKIGKKFVKAKRNREAFIEFWHIKHKTPRAMFLIKRSGILSNYLPEFQQISGQMQYDMFHSYTVDEHTLFLLKNLIEFSDEEAKSKYPLCHQIMEKQTHPELIYLAGLFHDIGKGQGGDHSEIGSEIAASFCQQHQMSSKHAEIISWLVANHLLMSLVAQKRDTSDPQVIKNFAKLVGTPQKLELLYVLTVADIRATSRSLWNSWKDSLLKELATATLALLKSEQTKDWEPWEDTKQAALNLLLDEGYSEEWIEHYWQYINNSYFLKNPAQTIAWHSHCILEQIGVDSDTSKSTVVAIRRRLDGGGSEIFVYSRDVDDLFASLTATLAQHGLNVQGASIYTDNNGYCYDSFFTLNNTGKPDISKVEKERLVKSVKQNIESLDSSKITIQKRMARQIKHFEVNTEIVFTKDEYSQYTRLDIVAKDRPGLLSLLAQAFKSCDIRLHDARITTLGEKVEDTFIISHKDNSPVDEPSARDQLIRVIKEQLSE